MLDTNHKNCGFAEQAIAFFYGEIDARGKATFETHLENCAPCAEELAGFVLARSAILEWRSVEFDALEIPKIEIPAAQNIYSPKTATALTEKQSWFGELRKIFAGSPAWATAGSFALLVVFAGLFLFTEKFSNNNQTAGINVKNSPSAKVSPTIEKSPEVIAKNLPENADRKLTEIPAKFTDSKRKGTPAKSFESAKTARAVDVSNNSRVEAAKTEIAAQRKSNSTDVRKIDNSNTTAKAALPVNKRRIPKLSGIEEDEDETLLLADLLDEVGSK